MQLHVAPAAFAGKLADRQSLAIPSQDPDYGDLASPSPSSPAQAKDAVLNLPSPRSSQHRGYWNALWSRYPAADSGPVSKR